MSTANEAHFVKDPSGKKLFVTRKFNAPLAKVWPAWTTAELLDKWWAPKPWKAETKSMNFTPGGAWYYSMVSPQNERHHNKVSFHTIEPGKSFSSSAIFCNENGEPTDGFPVMHWQVEFTKAGNTTEVNIAVSCDTEAGLQQMIQMGFQGGFTMGLNNLDELLGE